ncbi:MAG: phosphonate C-P lyase system protein PhnH [Planctomycetota bacterium]
MTSSVRGFTDLIDVEQQQAVYRALLRGFSYPGVATPLPSSGVNAVDAICATLVDENADLWLDEGTIPSRLVSSLGCQLVEPSVADLLVARGDRFALTSDDPKLGTLDRPDASATIVLACQSFENGIEVRVTGPGVESRNTFFVAGLSVDWLVARDDWCCRYPMGVDLLLVDAKNVVGIPRTSSLDYDSTATTA